MKVYSYLNFNGQAEEAIHFYQSILGGEIPGGMMYLKDMPDAPTLEENDKNRVLHVTLQLSKDQMIMASDTFPGLGAAYKQGNQCQVYLDLDSREKTKAVFEALSAGGEIDMPLEDTFWGSYFGSCTDRFGICWMVGFDQKEEE